MNSFSMNTLAKHLPSVCRQSKVQTGSLQSIRSITSTPNASASSTFKERSRSLESQLLNRGSQSSNDASPLSAITKMMQGDGQSSASRVSSDYARLAQSLEDDMLKNPYADHSPPHHLHVFAHKHNTIITLTRPNGSPIFSIGAGQIGFRKAGRSGFDPAYQLSAHVMGQIQERGLLMELKRLEIVYRGFGKGREAFTKVLLGNEGRHIRGLVSRVTDSTRLKFGGTRSRKVRRLG